MDYSSQQKRESVPSFSKNHVKSRKYHLVYNAVRILAGLFFLLLMLPPLSMRLVNIFVLSPGLFGLLIIIWPAIRALIDKTGPKNRRRILRILVAVSLSVLVYTSYALALIVPASRKEEPPEGAVVIVLGAQVINGHPSLSLWGRIEAAAEYLAANPSSICIASGGQGPDESISEAQCIYDTLVGSYHIDPERIILEDRSTNTRENIAFSKEIIAEKGLSADIAIATDGFHQYRAKKIILDNGLIPYALPARSDSRLILPMSIREIFAIGYESVRPDAGQGVQ